MSEESYLSPSKNNYFLQKETNSQWKKSFLYPQYILYLNRYVVK